MDDMFKSQSLPLVDGNGLPVDQVVETILVGPDDRVAEVHQLPHVPFLMTPAEMLGQRLQDLDLRYSIPICVAQARALKTHIPCTYEWWLDGRWVVRTLIAVPQQDGTCMLYIQHRGTRSEVH